MLTSFYKYCFFTLAVILSVSIIGCKSGGPKQQVVPEQKFECTTDLCREVVQGDQCDLKGGFWVENLGKCLSEVEYDKWRCELSDRVWSNETLNCTSKAYDDGLDADREREQRESPIRPDEDPLPDVDVPDTSVKIKVEIVE